MKAGPLASDVSQLDPSQMKAVQRAQEIADLLAIAWLRARMRGTPPASQVLGARTVTSCDTHVERDPVRLGFTADRSVNANPSQHTGVQ